MSYMRPLDRRPRIQWRYTDTMELERQIALKEQQKKNEKQGAERSDAGVDGGMSTGGGGESNVIVTTDKKGKGNKISGVGNRATAARASTKGRSGWKEGGVLLEEDGKVVEKALHRVLKTLETRASQVNSGFLVIVIRYAILALYGLPPKGAGRAMATVVAERAVADVTSKDNKRTTHGRAAAAASAASAASAAAAAAMAAAQGRQRESRRAAQRTRVPMTIEKAKKQLKEVTPSAEPALSDKLRIWLQKWAGTALKTSTVADVIIAIRHGAYCLPEPLQEAYRVLENAVQHDARRYSSDLAVIERKLRLPIFGTCWTCATSAKRLVDKQYSRSIQAAATGVKKEEAYEALVVARRAVSRGEQPPPPTRRQCVFNRKQVEKMAQQVKKGKQVESSNRRIATNGAEAIRATSEGKVRIGSRGGNDQGMRSLASSSSIRNVSPSTSKRQPSPQPAAAQAILQGNVTPVEKEEQMWSPASSTSFREGFPTTGKQKLRGGPGPAQSNPQRGIASLQEEQEMWSPASSTSFQDMAATTAKQQLRQRPATARPTPRRQVVSVEGKQQTVKAQGGQPGHGLDQQQQHYPKHRPPAPGGKGHAPQAAAADTAIRSSSQASVAEAGGAGAGIGRCGGRAGVFSSRGKILRFVEPQRELKERGGEQPKVPPPPYPPPPQQQQQQQNSDEDERRDGGTGKRAMSGAAGGSSAAGTAVGVDDTLDAAGSSDRSFSSRVPSGSSSNTSIVSHIATTTGPCDGGGGVSTLSSNAMSFEGYRRREYGKEPNVQSSPPPPPPQQQQQELKGVEQPVSPHSIGVAMRSSSPRSVAGASDGGADKPHGATSMPLAAGARADCNDTPDANILQERSSSSRAPLGPAKNVGNRLPVSGDGVGALSWVSSDAKQFVEPPRPEVLKGGKVATTTETPTEQQPQQWVEEGSDGDDTSLVKQLRQRVKQLEKENAKLLADNSAQAEDLKAAALAVGMAIIQRYRDLPADRHACLTAYSLDERAKASAAFAPRATWARIAAQAGVEFCLARQAKRASKGEDHEELEGGSGGKGYGGVGGSRSPSSERMAGIEGDSSGSGGDMQQEYQVGGRQRETYAGLENDEDSIQEGKASSVQDEIAVDDDEYLGQESEDSPVQLKANAAEAQYENRLSYDKWWEAESEQNSFQREENVTSMRGEDNAQYGECSSVRYSHAKGNSTYSNKAKRVEIGEIHCDHEAIGSRGVVGEDGSMSRLSMSGSGVSRYGSMLEEGGGPSSMILSGPGDRFHFEEMSVLQDRLNFEEM